MADTRETSSRGRTTPDLRGPSHPSLSVEEDLPFQRREWRWQRVGAAGLAALIGLSLLGVMSDRSVAINAVVVYAFVLAAFRIAGKRTVAQMTSFDLLLLLMIGDVAQPPIVGDDTRLMTAIVAISALICVDMLLGFAKQRWVSVDRVIDGLPLVLVDQGRLLDDRLRREGIDVSEILTAARDRQGLRTIEEIDFAVLERSGEISIIPRREAVHQP